MFMLVEADFDTHTLLLTLVGSGAAMKVALMAARTMPPPPDTCGFWCRWFFDFVQNFAENQDKVGKSQDPTKPIGVEKQVITASKTQVEAPPGVVVAAIDPTVKV